MKNLIKTLVPALVILPVVAHAQVGAGLCNYGNETVANVVCFGPADLEGTRVTGSVMVTGPLTINNASVNNVTVMGLMKSNGTQFKGQTKVYGPVTDSGSNFEQGLFSATNLLTLAGSKVSGNVTEKSSSEGAVLKMTNGAFVSGNVDFP